MRKTKPDFRVIKSDFMLRDSGFFIRKKLCGLAFRIKKSSGQERTCAKWKLVAKATALGERDPQAELFALPVL